MPDHKTWSSRACKLATLPCFFAVNWDLPHHVKRGERIAGADNFFTSRQMPRIVAASMWAPAPGWATWRLPTTRREWRANVAAGGATAARKGREWGDNRAASSIFPCFWFRRCYVSKPPLQRAIGGMRRQSLQSIILISHPQVKHQQYIGPIMKDHCRNDCKISLQLLMYLETPSLHSASNITLFICFIYEHY